MAKRVKVSGYARVTRASDKSMRITRVKPYQRAKPKKPTRKAHPEDPLIEMAREGAKLAEESGTDDWPTLEEVEAEFKDGEQEE